MYGCAYFAKLGFLLQRQSSVRPDICDAMGYSSRSNSEGVVDVMYRRMQFLCVSSLNSLVGDHEVKSGSCSARKLQRLGHVYRLAC